MGSARAPKEVETARAWPFIVAWKHFMIFMRKTVFLLDFRFSSFPDYKKSRSFVRFHPPASFGLSAKAAIPIQCKPGSPNTMAQRIQSFKDHPRTALTMGTTRPPNQLEIAPVAQTRLPTLPLGGILREKTHGLVRFHPHQRHLDEKKCTAISHHCLPNLIYRIVLTTTAITIDFLSELSSLFSIVCASLLSSLLKFLSICTFFAPLS